MGPHGVVNCAGKTSQHDQTVPFLFTPNSKLRVLSISQASVGKLQLNKQLVPVHRGQLVQILQPDPEIGGWISKPVPIVVPASFEADRTVNSLLNDDPSSTVCGHVTERCNGL